jgi:large exoprotein involved in heme utilization and adhesion
MSVSRNRELSQFSSFIFVDNNSENIGIATETTPSVGIGTTNPTSKFHVVGNTRLQGNVTVANGTLESSSYTLNGTPLVDATLAQWNFGSGTTNVYRLTGNVGIGTSVFAEKLTVLGNILLGSLFLLSLLVQHHLLFYLILKLPT